MITLIDQPVWLFDGTELVEADSVSEEKIKKWVTRRGYFRDIMVA